MGRYTSVQTYTDKDAKVAALAYSTAVEAQSDGAAPAAATADLPMAVKRAEAENGEKFATARVDNVSGSSAGAGSGDFHMYRAARRRELDRVERMEKEYAKRKEQEEFEAKRKRNLSEFESRAAKRAEKRRKRKDRAKARALDQALSGGEDDEKDDTGEEKTELPETPGGVPEIPNDGSFLERMLALQKQQNKDSGEDGVKE